jgi:hypothetical protein
MTMNQELLRQRAATLKELLLRYAPTNEEAKELLKALYMHIQQALDGTIAAPLDWREIPGDRLFDEGTLHDLPGLESAYTNFKIEITGGPSDVLRKLQQQAREEADRK